MNGLRIGVIGGVPEVLGGGGLEQQMKLTCAALERAGHELRPVHQLRRNDHVDLMHAFGNGADIWQLLRHWRYNRVPLVCSPVIVCSPGRSERNLLIGARLGAGRLPNVNSMTREIVRTADAVIALTDYERRVIGRLAPDARVRVIGNGVTPSKAAADSPLSTTERYVVMLGTVSARKQQIAAIEALGAQHRMVIVGGLDGDISEADFRTLVARTGSEWTGEVRDPAVVRRILTDASALLLLSDAEGQSLAVLEALACATPVVVSDLPSHTELAERHPGWVFPVRSLADAGSALNRLTVPASAPPKIPDWDEIAAQIVGVYEETLAHVGSGS